MGKTKIERVEVDRPDLAVFRIEGKLGFHENKKIEQLAEECNRRSFKKVIFDFLNLTSLGGGVARILRDFVTDCEKKGCLVHFAVTNDVVLDFLNDGDVEISVFSTLEEAIASGEKPSSAKEVEQEENKKEEKEKEEDVKAGGKEEKVEEASGVIMMAYEQNGTRTSKGQDGEGASVETDQKDEDVKEKDSNGPDSEEAGEGRTNEAEAESGSGNEGSKKTGKKDDSDRIISEIFDQAYQGDPPEWLESPTSPFESGGVERDSDRTQSPDEMNRKLKKRILELKTLFSISSDFNAIRSKKKLLDIFLLTSIAQGGIESALFLESKEGSFVPIVSKGIDKKIIEGLKIDKGKLANTARNNGTSSIDYLSTEEEIEPFKKLGFEHFCPFMINNEVAGICVLGKRISGRNIREEDFEFLDILSSVAQSSYRNTVMLEREHERTLGIVKTLISMIEENTLLKGTSEFVSRYVGIVAKKMNYPEENFKDLIYGTVLRDMGMIKISDLIVKSPRELTKEEWAVIKRHPDDGAEMLQRMRFSDSVVEIVKSHHERFNGEGYPRGKMLSKSKSI